MIMVRIPAILLLNILGVGLFLSWFLPLNHGYWFAIDAGIFHFFNQQLAHSRPFVWFVAITNNRAFDLCSLLCMGLLMLSYWLRATPPGRRQILITGVVMLLCAVVLNQLGKVIPVERASPTLYFHNIYRVSELLDFPTKDSSRDSFPGDHGLMLLIFCGFMLRYFGKKACAVAVIIFLVFIVPRMMSGAHWFSDVFVGSLSLALIGLPWWLMTPFSDAIIRWFNQRLPGKYKLPPRH
ncbi:phosphatase PAP2 family protein [Shimwellia blattae]|uniref:Lipid A 1-diphosphate synthase n=1 Tax=Shimwellia blattae (strain ATCC 29907 / DSM 4481 / JCM 1650 / NBRC 105725 / CDC 9005-74) TaxID=630626 RepID=I2B7D9_SHIBC|nr:phosphatase PAP2 family protein [Shimwellia blattae]AFJ46443.1 putative inner membrane protein YeiU [Shimwellia blattae DSM 4481 = NBRC 105725]VDY63911.1 Inner membrane protein yeiU [Shimwellia blattae]VEC22047.1 Inner membrane protein yeiU [Shimwellia blattae]